MGNTYEATGRKLSATSSQSYGKDTPGYGEPSI